MSRTLLIPMLAVMILVPSVSAEEGVKEVHDAMETARPVIEGATNTASPVIEEALEPTAPVQEQVRPHADEAVSTVRMAADPVVWYLYPENHNKVLGEAIISAFQTAGAQYAAIGAILDELTQTRCVELLGGHLCV